MPVGDTRIERGSSNGVSWGLAVILVALAILLLLWQGSEAGAPAEGTRDPAVRLPIA